MCTTLYQRTLGSRFAELHPTLRRFHGSTGGGRAAGWCRVRRLGGGIKNLVAALCGVPQPSRRVWLRLEVQTNDHGERWVRYFGTQQRTTEQYTDGELLIERYGPLRLALQLDVADGGMTFTTYDAWLGLLRLPRWLRPEVNASVTPDEEGWRFVVRGRLGILGPLFEYDGYVRPTCNQH